MSTVLQSPISPHLTVYANGRNPRKLWSRTDVHDFVRLGKLAEDAWELLEGDIVFKVSKGQPRVFVTQEAAEWLEGIFGRKYVTTESPIRYRETSEPEPDIVVTHRPRRDYLSEGDAPNAETEIQLVVEVTDSTVYQDRIVKARLYAQFGIPEYWMVDIERRLVRVHRAPENGVYTDISDRPETETLLPLAASAQSAPRLIAELLP